MTFLGFQEYHYHSHPPLWFFSGSTPLRTFEIPYDNYRRGFKLTPVAIKRKFFGVHCATYKQRRLRFGINTINTYSRHTSVIP